MKAKTYLGIVGLAIVGVFAALHETTESDAAYINSPDGRAEAARQAELGDIQAGEMLVQSRLRDPESASFVGAKLVKVGRQKVVCGFVNAKNGFGGMAGYEYFAVVDSKTILGNDGYDALDRIERLCGDQA